MDPIRIEAKVTIIDESDISMTGIKELFNDKIPVRDHLLNQRVWIESEILIFRTSKSFKKSYPNNKVTGQYVLRNKY